MRVTLTDSPDVVIAFQVGAAVDLLDFSLKQAIERAGNIRFAMLAITWNTSSEVYAWLNKEGIENIDIPYSKEQGFLSCLYDGWNACFDWSLKLAPYMIITATDHRYYFGWAESLCKYKAPNRIVCCKLIERGHCDSIHTTRDFGSVRQDFDQVEFDKFCGSIHEDTLVIDDNKYGHRLDGAPFLMDRQTWEKFGPWKKELTWEYIDNYGRWTGWQNVTGDTRFFLNAKRGGVEITKSLSAISYHQGALESSEKKAKGEYQ